MRVSVSLLTKKLILVRSVCPEGKHVIHVYSSGGEPYEPWEKLEPGSEKVSRR